VNLKNNLRQLIKANNLNALKLSKATAVPRSTISDWLNGVEPKGLQQLKNVALYFKVSVDKLCFGELNDKSNIEPTEQSELIDFGKFDVYLKRVK
jgi:transcriptional regulator with XRE-family HTH domain